MDKIIMDEKYYRQLYESRSDEELNNILNSKKVTAGEWCAIKTILHHRSINSFGFDYRDENIYQPYCMEC